MLVFPATGPATDIFGDNHSPWKAPAKNCVEPATERVKERKNPFRHAARIRNAVLTVKEILIRKVPLHAVAGGNQGGVYGRRFFALAVGAAVRGSSGQGWRG